LCVGGETEGRAVQGAGSRRNGCRQKGAWLSSLEPLIIQTFNIQYWALRILIIQTFNIQFWDLRFLIIQTFNIQFWDLRILIIQTFNKSAIKSQHALVLKSNTLFAIGPETFCI